MTKEDKRKTRKPKEAGKSKKNKAPTDLTPEQRQARYSHSTYTIEDFEKAIEGCNGKKRLIIRRLGCSSRTLYTWLEKHPELNELIENEMTEYKDDMFDVGMTNIMKLLLKEDPTTSRWVVDRLGAKQGFVQKTAITDENGDQPYTTTVIIGTTEKKLSDEDDRDASD